MLHKGGNKPKSRPVHAHTTRLTFCFGTHVIHVELFVSRGHKNKSNVTVCAGKQRLFSLQQPATTCISPALYCQSGTFFVFYFHFVLSDFRLTLAIDVQSHNVPLERDNLSGACGKFRYFPIGFGTTPSEKKYQGLKSIISQANRTGFRDYCHNW